MHGTVGSTQPSWICHGCWCWASDEKIVENIPLLEVRLGSLQTCCLVGVAQCVVECVVECGALCGVYIGNS